MDNGLPQIVELDTLRLYIAQEGFRQDLLTTKSNVTIQATGGTPWRREGIRYRKNELFIDVVEAVNILVSQKGTILRGDVSGQIMMKSYLSGMPECKFGMNDKLVVDKEGANPVHRAKAEAIALDDCTFHQCVKLSAFHTERTVSFVPPDGEFELMRYRISQNINVPFRIFPLVKELGRTRLEIKVTVKSTFSPQVQAQMVEMIIPVPSTTATCKIRSGAGKAKYEPEKSAIVWRMKRFPGSSEFTLAADVNLVSATHVDAKAWTKPPIAMNFQVPMFTSSGLKVRYLKVFEKSNYQPVKWVRYVTKNGLYEHRI
jgi:AP-2 complex subunit mu-1